MASLIMLPSVTWANWRPAVGSGAPVSDTLTMVSRALSLANRSSRPARCGALPGLSSMVTVKVSKSAFVPAVGV
ncbi:hypothetical protein BN1047_04723 [Mycolicibacterium neoaurum]|uniref:Secreted protein n=1 Tax=Mycolicibacterium neoaurum TaxID=1795 RepID=A0AAV2WR21_MYCNE|nr:hypothetical protein [Mycolicibacterium neoaurum]TLH58943.1 hypothetical protein C1S81_12670 [Mycolicibacterium neoaurum]CDQ46809.1 hypothetical protein BN1047_04723 [Mycolicibacterium neoaurum]